MRQAPAPKSVAKRIEDRIVRKLDAIAKPSPYTKCPSELAMAVSRNIDAREPAETIHATYAPQHRQPVRKSELLDRERAIERVLALERAQPVVVPAGFRAELVEHARDPEFRLHMARCELASMASIRRAGYDAALAVLLGARVEDALPLIRQSLFPDGERVRSCSSNADCNGSCDAVSKVCASVRGEVASKLSVPESEIEDALVRAFANRLTQAQIENDRYVPGDVVEMFVYGRYVRCGTALCRVRRFDIDGKTRLVYWDRRDRGATTDREEQPWEVCYRETKATTRGSCIAKCEGGSQRASCVATCTSLCPVATPQSSGTDDD